MNQSEQFYSIVLPDMAAPLRYPRVKPYYGTTADIERVLQDVARDSCFEKVLNSTLEGYWEYMHGYEDATHFVWGEPYQLLTPVEMLESRVTEVNHHSWQHMDVAGKRYHLEADHGVLEEAVFKTGALYARCVRAKLRNVQFYRNGKKEPVFSGCPCIPGIFGYQEQTNELEMRLFVEESFFFEKDEALRDMRDNKRIDYHSISMELLGDVRTF